MNRINRIYSTIIFGIVMILVSCQQNNSSQGWNQGPAELPIGIIQKGSVVIQKEYPASIEGVANVEIRPQVSGYLNKILVDEGEYVTQGQILFKIEDRVYNEQLNSAKASLLSAKSALANAKIDFNRKKELVNSKIVSNLQLQEAESVLNAANAAVDNAYSLVKSAQINLSFCTIKAPVNGYIGRIPYKLGSLVAIGNTEALTFLSDIHQINAYFSLSENDFVSFQKQFGQKKLNLGEIPKVNLLMSDGHPYELKGSIDAVEGQFNKATGSITLRAKFNNPKSILRSGNTGKIKLDQQYNNVVLVPVASTITIQDKVFVFSLDKDSKAVQLPIEIAGKADNNFIVSSGISSGDQYIISGFDRLQAGTSVVSQNKTKKINN